ncbi:MAG: KTSC domain-containing protein [Treponema sp.]|nr:KTSC domain-containing protein [Treponema sp.]
MEQETQRYKPQNNWWETLKNKLSSKDRKSSETLQKKMDEGKTITLVQPKSQRYTFNKHIAEQTKKLDNFTPTTEGEKASLSPNGYFRIGEIPEERKAYTLRRIDAAKDTMGGKLTKSQQKLVEKQAENEPINSVDIPSTAIQKVKYDPETQELWVTFTGSSKKYWYPRVPKEAVTGLMNAESKGEYFIENIHNVYSVNPGHKPSKNQWRNEHVAKNYYKKMQKQYKNVRKTGNVYGYKK